MKLMKESLLLLRDWCVRL